MLAEEPRPNHDPPRGDSTQAGRNNDPPHALEGGRPHPGPAQQRPPPPPTNTPALQTQRPPPRPARRPKGQKPPRPTRARASARSRTPPAPERPARPGPTTQKNSTGQARSNARPGRATRDRRGRKDLKQHTPRRAPSKCGAAVRWQRAVLKLVVWRWLTGCPRFNAHESTVSGSARLA